MNHIVLHVAAPVLIALAFYRPRWLGAASILLATMVVDMDHLFADPIYDAGRCSIGFHPLHTAPAITLYLVLAVLPLAWRRKTGQPELHSAARMVHLIGIGLLIHMVLDWGDCVF